MSTKSTSYVVHNATNSAVGDNAQATNTINTQTILPSTGATPSTIKTEHMQQAADVITQRVLALLSPHLKAHETQIINEIQTNAVLQTVADDTQMVILENIRSQLVQMRQTLQENTPQNAEQAAFTHAVTQAADLIEAPALDARHRLKVAIPLMPAILSYETELELNERLNLEELWLGLRRQVAKVMR
ncbi:MAG: hypothetical protein AAF639_07835 [Chloroflexota bacterium]